MTEQTEVLRYIVGPVCTNCYLLVNHKTGELLVVDPGDQAQLIEKQIEKTGAKPVAILLTHGHFDHAGAAEALADKYQISIYAHEAERETLDVYKRQSMFKCASLALPCASVAGCQTKFQVPLTALKMHPYFGEPGSYHVKHWKDCFDNRKKNMCFRTAAFHIKNNLPCIPGTIFKILYFLQSPPQTT